MAETNTPPNTQTQIPPVAAPNPEKHNAEVANALIKNSDLVNAPADTGSAIDALDKLAEKVTKEREAAPAVEPKVTTPPATPPTETAEQKKTREEAEKKTADELEAANKFFKDAPALPTNASPKSSEAFNSVKVRAAQEISKRDAELDTLKKQLSELQEKAKNPLSPEVEKELQDHRSWRAKLDVESDPKFKEFDKEISSAHEFIYSQLKKSPVVTDEVIAEIKKIGGPELVNLSKLFEAIKDPTLQKIVESKVADIEMTKFKKTQAIESTKANIDQYMTDRQKQIQAATTQHTVVTKQKVEQLAGQLDWLKDKAVDPKSDEPTRAATEEHNKFVKETREQLSAALQDDSADMRAILLVGMAQLFNYQRLHAKATAELEATKKSLAEVQEKWEKVKNASTSRLRESAAPSGGVPRIKPADQFNVRAGDALDNIAKQVMTEREAKANT